MGNNVRKYKSVSWNTLHLCIELAAFTSCNKDKLFEGYSEQTLLFSPALLFFSPSSLFVDCN